MEPWSPREDAILLSSEKDAVKSIIEARGLEAVEDRIAYIES